MSSKQMSNNNGDQHEERYYSRNYWYERETNPNLNLLAL